ncbi:MAG: TetR/AcrR family transcriptional regulator [Pseudomonadota bacterium]
MAERAGSEGGDLAEARIDAIRDAGLVETRRAQILDASLQLFLKKGYAAVTIREICAASGVNQASLYDYIANKQDILRRLLNRLWFARDIEGLADRLAADPAPVSEVLRAYYAENWKTNRDAILLAYRSVPHLTPEDRKLLREREERVIRELSARLAERTGALEEDPRVRTVSNFLIYLNAFGPFRDWLMRDGEEDVMLEMVGAAVDAMVARLG